MENSCSGIFYFAKSPEGKTITKLECPAEEQSLVVAVSCDRCSRRLRTSGAKGEGEDCPPPPRVFGGVCLCVCIGADIQAGRYLDTQADWQTNRLTERMVDIKTNRYTVKWLDKQNQANKCYDDIILSNILMYMYTSVHIHIYIPINT